jgi:hypothetical protein
MRSLPSRRGRFRLPLLLASLTALGGAAPALAHEDPLHPDHTMASHVSVLTGAHTSFTRTWHWSIDKTVSHTQLTLAEGQSFEVTYTVTVNATPTDSNHRVFDGILVETTDPVTLAGVTDAISPGGIAANVTCPFAFPYTFSGFALCFYDANLPDGSPRTNTATVALSDGSSASGSFAFDFSAAEITQENACVDVSDSFAGTLGTVCAGVHSLPATFTYKRTIGPHHACGEFTYENTASATTQGLHPVTVSDSATVHVTVPCAAGCTRTIGYWKTHAGFGPQADVVTPLLPIWLGTAGGSKSILVDSAAEAVQYLSMNGDASNGINKLYAQLLGAKLNIASGASSSGIASTIAAADAFLAQYNSASWSSLSKSQRSQVLSWMTALDNYNNGLVGPPHCDE